MDPLLIDITVFSAGVGLGFGIGYKIAFSTIVTTAKRECDVWFNTNKHSFAQMTITYHGRSIITNDCPALVGKRCKYTDKKSHLL